MGFFSSLFNSTVDTREFIYAEMNDGDRDEWSIRNDQYKLIERASGEKELYDLNEDPYENTDLMLQGLSPAANQAKIALEAELLVIRN